MTLYVLGVDPGVFTGVTILRLDPAESTGQLTITERSVYGCNHGAVFGLVQYLVEACGQADPGAAVIAAGEKFIPGRGAGATGPQAAATRKVIADLNALPVEWKWHTASEVKTWADNNRLVATKLYGMTNKSIDARDSARVALFAACRYAGLPDPLSRKARLPWMALPRAWGACCTGSSSSPRSCSWPQLHLEP